MAKKSAAIDMTQGSPISLMLRFALPMMIGGVFQNLYHMVDSAVLGRYVGSEALAAIGSSSSTTHMLLMLATSITSAVSIVISQHIGSGNKEKIRSGMVSTIYLTVVVGILLGLISLVAARPLMNLLKTPDNIIDDAVLYIQFIGGFCIVSFTYNSASSILRAIGDSTTPLIFLIICSVLNVILDLVAVIGLNLEVAGVAIATLVSQAISAVLCILYMFKKYPFLRISVSDLKPDMKETFNIFFMGAQMALQSALLSVGMMVITRVINGYGSDVVAAFTVGSNVQNLAAMLFSNFAFGFSVYVGQNWGARNMERIQRGVRDIFLLLGGLTLFATLLSQIFARFLVGLYVNAEEVNVVAASLSFVRIQACFFPFLGWIWLFNSTMKGMGKIPITMASSFVELGSKIGLSILLPILMGSYVGIWYAAPIGWILGILPTAVYYYGGFWKKALKKLIEKDAADKAKAEAAAAAETTAES
ncbi:MAG: MATE family efflux transporter [Clostridia bacterium]|nr:MATE family efflux transporter [Clostridia bacterium]